MHVPMYTCQNDFCEIHTIFKILWVRFWIGFSRRDQSFLNKFDTEQILSVGQTIDSQLFCEKKLERLHHGIERKRPESINRKFDTTTPLFDEPSEIVTVWM